MWAWSHGGGGLRSGQERIDSPCPLCCQVHCILRGVRVDGPQHARRVRGLPRAHARRVGSCSCSHSRCIAGLPHDKGARAPRKLAKVQQRRHFKGIQGLIQG